MLVLGLSGNFSGEYTDLTPNLGVGFFHDAAACLVRDGVLIAAVEEERLNRIKKTTKFPINAIRAVLTIAQASVEDIDGIGYYFQEETVDDALNEVYRRTVGLPVRSARDLIADHLRAEFAAEYPRERIFFAEHHRSHALSGLSDSGMGKALVLVMDGRGDQHSTTVFRADRGRLESLATYGVGKSLGYFYAAAITALGYGLGDEYKIMGLAPYGDPDVYRDIFASLYTLRPNGDFTLAPLSRHLRRMMPAPRRAGEDFTRQHMDFAASVQHTLEVIAMHVLRHWQAETGLTNLCFTGGVAHNSTLNGLILRSGLFEDVFIHPASHDAGAAGGAAIAAARRLGLPEDVSTRLRHASLGPALGATTDIEKELSGWSDVVEFEWVDDIVDRAARLLAGGAVIGWTQGAAEFGPRALGNRSILADARPAGNKDRINLMVKKREAYRPFAPVVTPEAAAGYFDLPATRADYDFMSFVVDVRAERRAELGAVTHVDGSARVQIVEPDANPRFHRLVTRFGELTGTPVLLNTSFNNNAEPIVQTVADALTCLLTTEIDCLVIEDFLIRRIADRPDLTGMVVEFRPVTRLSATRTRTAAGGYETVHEIYLDHNRGDRARLSAALHAILDACDGTRTVGSLAEATGGWNAALHDELFGLWQRRFFALRPAALRSA